MTEVYDIIAETTKGEEVYLGTYESEEVALVIAKNLFSSIHIYNENLDKFTMYDFSVIKVYTVYVEDYGFTGYEEEKLLFAREV